MPKVLIRDGQTQRGVAKAEYGNPEVTFTYRPALPVEVLEYFDRADNAVSARDKMKVIVEFLAHHVQNWDVENDHDEERAPVNSDTLNRVPHSVIMKMVDIVLGYNKRLVEDAKK